jgi:large conductance mechanosensitive channel
LIKRTFSRDAHSSERSAPLRRLRVAAKQCGLPLIAALLPVNEGYKAWTLELNGKSIPYGLFLGEVVNFLLVALILFLFIVKFLGWVMHTKKAEAAIPPPPTKDQELLMEIRDLLKAQSQKPA